MTIDLKGRNLYVYNSNNSLLAIIPLRYYASTRYSRCDVCGFGNFCMLKVFGVPISFETLCCDDVLDELDYIIDMDKLGMEPQTLYRSICGKVVKKNLRKNENKNTRQYSLGS